MNNPKMSPGQILNLCAQIASELNGSDISVEMAQKALKNPDCAKKIVAIINNGGFEGPRFKYGKLTLVDLFLPDEYFIPTDEFRARAEKAGAKAGTQHAYDFYSKQENSKLIPDMGGGIKIALPFIDESNPLRCGILEPHAMFSGWIQNGIFFNNGFSKGVLVGIPSLELIE